MLRKVVKLKKNTEKEVIEFIEKQGNFTDAMVFLIQQEIYNNGIRNLNEHIPTIRTKEFFHEYNKDSKKTEITKEKNWQNENDKKEKKDTNETKKIDIESIYGG